ncbi:MAG TPA: hypothetical protein PLJ85_04735 [Candidatus Cloacimonas sp.]|nr:hypothetical protein [Candidatus Cloacimonas sp.]
MPNSDSANALRHTFTNTRFRTRRNIMGCRTPIRQMPSGILSLTPDLEPGEI